MNHYRSRVREVINRNEVVNLALAQGFNAFLPVYDGGVDFILYRERNDRENADLRKVQLKSRWTIHRKYIGRDIWIAFPSGSSWYLMPHDAMLAAAEAEGVTRTPSWINEGSYSRPKLSAATLQQCAEYQFGTASTDAASEPEAQHG